VNDNTYLIRHERCPRCASLGRDNTGNNLAIYSDGHSYCFGGCGLVTSGNLVLKFKSQQNQAIDKTRVFLPEDCDMVYPQRALDWVGQYNLTTNDLLNHNTLWSESQQRLIFPIFGENDLIAWQGRYFGREAKVKWWGQGDLKNTYNILGKGDTLILVEDIISAIKLSRFTSVMPLYGNAIGIERFRRVAKLFKKVGIWLDPDMKTKSLTEQRRGQLCGLDVRVIFSDKDPKELTSLEICAKLGLY